MVDIAHLLQAEIPGLLRYAKKLTRDPSDADDLLQECLTRAWVKQHQWVPGTNITAWLRRLMHNRYVDGVRSNSARGRYISASEPEVYETIPAPEIDPLVKLVVRDLKRAWAMLSADQQRALALVVGHEMTYDAAALIEGTAVGTIKSRLSRGRDRLRMHMDGAFEGA